MRSGFTSSDLKCIAMGTMAVDHAAVMLLHGGGFGAETAMRLIGRVAFPLYAFLLVQGFLYTRDWKRYLGRMAVLAAVSEIPFNLVAAGELVYPQVQNTVVLLCIGLAMLAGMQAAARFPADWREEAGGGAVARPEGKGAAWLPKDQKAESGGGAPMRPTGMKTIRSLVDCEDELWLGAFRSRFLSCLAALTAMAAAEVLNADYGALGILFILVLYLFRYRPMERTWAGAAVLILCEGPVYGLAAWIAFFFINRYNGEKGRNLGHLPYAFYPLHLLIIYTAGVFIYGYNF